MSLGRWRLFPRVPGVVHCPAATNTLTSTQLGPCNNSFEYVIYKMKHAVTIVINLWATKTLHGHEQSLLLFYV